MKLTLEMGDPQGTIFYELADGRFSQESVAITYAFIIAQLGETADWPKINQAIRERWKSKMALTRIKNMAWENVEGWVQRGKEERPALLAEEAGK